MEIIRKVVKLGNGAGVLLPKDWYGGEARVELVQRPIRLEEDIFSLLKPYLQDILGIYIVGSYSRKEETDRSDVDVLVISSKTNEKIISGKYNIAIISKDDLEKSIKAKVLPFYPMIHEARTLINADLLDKIKRIKLSLPGVARCVKETESSLNIIKGLVEGEEKVSGGLIYTLVFRIRGLYILKKAILGENHSNFEFRKILQKEKISKECYDIYRAEKLDQVTKPADVAEATRLLAVAEKLLEEVRCLKIKR